MTDKIPGSFMNPYGAMYPTKKDQKQQDQNAAYNARVRDIAKKLANKEIDSQLASGRTVKLNLTTSGLDKRINKHMLGARAMVAEMAESFRQGFNSMYDFTDDSEIGPYITKGLQDRGLIPSPPNATGSDTDE